MKKFEARAFALLAALATSLAADRARAVPEEAPEGFTSIFDGKTLEGWDGNPQFWKVEGGAIVGQTTAENKAPGNTFLIWRQGELDDFELVVEYRITGGNSGIQVRSFEDEKKWGKWVIGGYQADFEAGNNFSGIIYGERYRDILAARGQKTVVGSDHKPKVTGSVGDSKEIQSHIKKEDWNRYEISASGNRIALKINGQATAEMEDQDREMRRRSGLLALQLHAGPPMKVEFRSILLKRLKMEDKKKIVLVAGIPSHDSGAHEHNAGCLLLAKALNENVPAVHAAVYRSGWPKDPTAFQNADAIVMYCDGGGGHPVMSHLEEVDRLAKKGVGIACIHYGVEVPKGRSGERFLDWIGGYFETEWSVNPHWEGNFEKFPEHPITRGVKPFKINDEWYYHMRFPEDMKGVTPILSAVPPEATRNGPDGTHSGNKYVRERKGMSEVVAWARERPDGGRGFGFTGGHVHWNWGQDDFRKLVLNALVWVARAEVGPDGVPSKTPTREDLEANQDEPKPPSR